MNAATGFWGRCVNAAKDKKLVQTVLIMMRSERAIETQLYPKGLLEISVQAQLTYIPSARQRSCWRLYGAVTATSLRFYCVLIRTQSHAANFVHVQSTRRRLAFYNFRGDPNATNEDAAALLRRCRRLYCVYLCV